MKWQFIEDKCENQGLTVFTSQDLRRVIGLSANATKQLLIRYGKKGVIIRLKSRRGLYCLKRKMPHPWLVANKLLRPSYISLETALAHYGAIPESVFSVTSVTPLITRQFEALNTVFTFQKVKGSAYVGYHPLEVEGSSILIAELDKALADTLYFVHLGKKTLNERIRWSLFNKKSVVNYLETFQRRGLASWGKNVIASQH